MYSIQKKLNLTIVTGMVLVLMLSSIFLYYLIARQVQNVFDSTVLDKAQALISITELDEEGLEFDFTEGMMPEFEVGENAQYYQVWLKGEEMLVKSPSLRAENLPRLNSPLGQHIFADHQMANGVSVRLIEITFLPRVEMDADEEDEEEPEADNEQLEQTVELLQAEPVSLAFAREQESLKATLLNIALTIALVIILVLVFSGFMIRRLIGGGLMSLSSLANQVGKIDESNLDLRITHEGEQSIEIAPIEDQLNHLLSRLESAFEREKRFSSNVAHELRTPLSELKTLAEVGKMLPEDRDQIEGFFTDVADISSQMEKVLVMLLELARSDAGLLRVDPEDIELNDYCNQVWHQVSGTQDAGKTLLVNIADDLVVHTDRAKLGMILSNLFTNALSYSPQQAEIKIEASIRNNNVVLEVSNTATDLKPEDILHMSDRFWRKQRAGGESGHAGLGLSLVDALAKIMNLKVKLQLDQQKTLLVRISGLSAA